MTYQRIKILSCRILLYLCRKMFKQMPKVKVYILWVWLVVMMMMSEKKTREYSRKTGTGQTEDKSGAWHGHVYWLDACTTEEQAYLQIALYFTFLFLLFVPFARSSVFHLSPSKSPSAITSLSNMVITTECKMANMFVLLFSGVPMKI